MIISTIKSFKIEIYSIFLTSYKVKNSNLINLKCKGNRKVNKLFMEKLLDIIYKFKIIMTFRYFSCNFFNFISINRLGHRSCRNIYRRKF